MIFDKKHEYTHLPLFHYAPVARFPKLYKIFSDRKIDTYWGMDEKDSEMLQFWGTDWRRACFDRNYWVTRLMEKIDYLSFSPDLDYILIPDTRFLNELDAVKNRNGVYIKVIRYNLDGSEYRDPSRDPEHSSETELENTEPDMCIKAISGELDKFEEAVDYLQEYLKEEST